jgi:hypothetical protein
MPKSNTKWLLESRPREPNKEAELLDQLQCLSISQLTSLWRAVVAELKNRALKTEAVFF